MNWLFLSVFILPLALLIWPQSRLAGIVTGLGAVAGGILIGWMFNTLGFLSRNMHSIALGRLQGAAVAGIYSRAEAIRGLMVDNLLLAPNLVAAPGLARLQDQPERYRRFYRRA